MNTRQVALFQRVGSPDWLTTWCARQDLTEREADDRIPDGYVRISPWLEIKFPALEQGAIIEKQLSQLDKAEANARAKLQSRLSTISDMRASLLALTAPR